MGLLHESGGSVTGRATLGLERGRGWERRGSDMSYSLDTSWAYIKDYLESYIGFIQGLLREILGV